MIFIIYIITLPTYISINITPTSNILQNKGDVKLVYYNPFLFLYKYMPTPLAPSNPKPPTISESSVFLSNSHIASLFLPESSYILSI